ncbi:MAG: DJ-1 family glyoxalase III [Puniceicoccales bacterium]
MKKRVLMLLETGFEEIETISPIDILRRAGAEVVIAATGEDLLVNGKTGIRVQADALLADCHNEAFDALVVPGGPAAQTLRKNAMVLDTIRTFYEKNLLVAAICAAPTVLNEAAILSGKRYTAHFSVAGELEEILPEPVVQDGNLITSQGAGTAVPFGLALVADLYDDETAKEIADSICFPKSSA